MTTPTPRSADTVQEDRVRYERDRALYRAKKSEERAERNRARRERLRKVPTSTWIAVAVAVVAVVAMLVTLVNAQRPLWVMTYTPASAPAPALDRALEEANSGPAKRHLDSIAGDYDRAFQDLKRDAENARETQAFDALRDAELGVVAQGCTRDGGRWTVDTSVGQAHGTCTVGDARVPVKDALMLTEWMCTAARGEWMDNSDARTFPVVGVCMVGSERFRVDRIGDR